MLLASHHINKDIIEYIIEIPMRGTFPVWDGGCSAEVVVLNGLSIRNRDGAGFFFRGNEGFNWKKVTSDAATGMRI